MAIADPIKEIVRCTGHGRGTVRRILRGQRAEVVRTRESSLDAHLPWLDARWAAGARNAAALWRELRDLGFRGSLSVVAEWATRRRRSKQVNVEGLSRVPSARTVARLMTMARDGLATDRLVSAAAYGDQYDEPISGNLHHHRGHDCTASTSLQTIALAVGFRVATCQALGDQSVNKADPGSL